MTGEGRGEEKDRKVERKSDSRWRRTEERIKRQEREATGRMVKMIEW